MEGGKPCINIVLLGHVDSGKSFTCGQLMYLCGEVDKRAVERYERNQTLWQYRESPFQSWALDQLHHRDERERGITINSKFKKIETPRFSCTLVDAPGHRNFIKETIVAISHADAAILIVSASQGEFETGIGREGQTREHLLLAFTLGIRQLIVAVNKMDHESVASSQARYNEIVDQSTKLIRKTGFKADSFSFLPMSSLTRDNMVEPPRRLGVQWWEGRTLLQSIDHLNPPVRPIDLPLRIPLLGVFEIRGIGTVPVGRIATGTLRRGMDVVFAPSGITTRIVSIESHRRPLEEAVAGDSVGMFVPRVNFRDLRRGMVVGDASNHPPSGTASFIAQIIVVNHPTEIRRGYTPVAHCHTTRFPCRFERFISKLDRRTGMLLEEDPQSIRSGDCVTVEMIPLRPVCVEPFSEFPLLGRFVILDSRTTVAAGIVKSVVHKSSEPKITKAAIKRP